MDTYKGESWPKKLARYAFWEQARKSEPFYRYPILCLASREAGDVAVLKSLGVSPSNIVAVDLCEDAVREARDKHPDVNVVHDDVGSFAKRFNGEFGAALLDFCGPISVRLAKTISDVARKVSPKGDFGVAVLRGREGGVCRDLLDEEFRKGFFRDYLKRFLRNAGYPNDDGNIDEIEGGVKNWGRGTTITILVEEFDKTLFLFPTGTVSYQSITSESNGVPMIICSFRVAKLNRYRLSKSKMDAVSRLSIECVEHFFNELPVVNPEQADEIIKKFHAGNTTLPPLNLLTPKSVIACKKSCAAIIREAGTDNAGLLNLTKQQAAALLAHDTMGTYA